MSRIADSITGCSERHRAPIDAARGRSVIAAARAVLADYIACGVTFQLQLDGCLPGTSDCSLYVADVMQAAALAIPHICTWEIETSPWYQVVSRREARAGDVIVQPGHMGIYLGETFVRRGRRAYLAYEMTRRGPRRPIGTWGPAGVHAGGSFTEFYRACERRIS